MLCAACGETAPREAERCPICSRSPLLEGRYVLTEIIGRGGSGTTYRAERLSDGIEVAIKEYPLRLIDDTKALELCEREAAVLRQLDHPSVPKCFDAFHAGTGRSAAYYLVQSLIEGRTLAQEMVELRYDEEAVLLVVAEIARVLSYLHSLSPPIIHRDLKPNNVMRRPDGTLVLIDFGSVRDAVKDPALGGSTVAGTFGYMAPEQFSGIAVPATDLYALGALTVALLTRASPETFFDGRHRLNWRPYVTARPSTLALLERLLEPNYQIRLSSADKVAFRASATIAHLGASEASTVLAIRQPVVICPACQYPNYFRDYPRSRGLHCTSCEHRFANPFAGKRGQSPALRTKEFVVATALAVGLMLVIMLLSGR